MPYGSDPRALAAPRRVRLPAAPRSGTVPFAPSPAHAALDATGTFHAGGAIKCFVNGGNQQRLRRDGTITRIRANIESTTYLSWLQFSVWRLDASKNYVLIGATDQIPAGDVAAYGWNSFDLADYGGAIDVHQGDLLGITCSQTSQEPFIANRKDTTGTSVDESFDTVDYSGDAVTDAAGGALVFEDWLAGYGMEMEALGDPPLVCFCSDSTGIDAQFGYLLDGADSHYAWENATIHDMLATYLAGEDTGITKFPTVQIHGLGGSTATAWATSGSDYVTSLSVDYLPRAAVVLFGINDSKDSLANTPRAYLDAMEEIVTTMLTHSITPIVCTPTPYQGGTSTEKARIEQYRHGLLALCARYRVLLVDTNRLVADPADPTVLAATYRKSDDDVHPNKDAQKAMAHLIADATILT